MPVIYDLEIPLKVDDVLRGQGAVPWVIRQRSPKLIPFAEKALAESATLIKPIVIYKELDAVAFAHNQLTLENGETLSGDFVKKYLSQVVQVIVAACTISNAQQQRVSQLAETNIVYALALDGAGSSAVESLAGVACKWFEDQAAEKGWKATIPLNPGMIGWTVADGQKQVFNILEQESNEITLNEGGIMSPFKSLSFVLGFGTNLSLQGSPCDVCSLRESCIYKKTKQTA